MDPLTPEQLSGYLFRVKLPILTVPVKPDLHTLCRIHLAHVQHIPYENLSLHLDKVSRGSGIETHGLQIQQPMRVVKAL